VPVSNQIAATRSCQIHARHDNDTLSLHFRRRRMTPSTYESTRIRSGRLKQSCWWSVRDTRNGSTNSTSEVRAGDRFPLLRAPDTTTSHAQRRLGHVAQNSSSNGSVKLERLFKKISLRCRTITFQLFYKNISTCCTRIQYSVLRA
jgi:hypothetical protein